MTIAYRGTQYHGWQTQSPSACFKGPMPKAGDGLPTIQELLTKALRKVLGHPVIVSGSSRTDARVHAKGQVAHFDTPMTQVPVVGLRRACNSRLPDDILIRAIEPVPGHFDAIRSTFSKRYQYVVWNEYDRPPFFGDLVFHRWQALNFDAMKAAASLLEGTHDFASFARPGHKRAGTVRTIHSCSVARRGPRIVIGVEGSGFLWNMVRIIAGTLIDIGQAKYPPGSITDMIAARDRRVAGNTAPPQGLYLQWIKYRPLDEPPAYARPDEDDE